MKFLQYCLVQVGIFKVKPLHYRGLSNFILYDCLKSLSRLSEMNSIDGEKQLLNALANGEEEALNTIYQQYWEPLFLKAYSILKDRHACEDVIQEIFIKLWDSRERLNITVSLKAYLFASCRYSIYRQIRSGTVREDIFDHIYEQLQASHSHEELEYKEMLAQANHIINQLPDKCKQVYKLSREENLSHKEIAEKMNISPKTVENHITRALHQLRTSLNNGAVLGLLHYILKF